MANLDARKIVGIVMMVIGVGLMFFSNYISDQVEIGRGKADSAQQKVDAGNYLFSKDPNTKVVGKVLTSPVQGQIDQGNRDILKYETLAGRLQIGGILLIISGGVVVFYPRRRSLR